MNKEFKEELENVERLQEMAGELVALISKSNSSIKSEFKTLAIHRIMEGAMWLGAEIGMMKK